jgi:lipopolysaccharide export system permease protein
MKIVDRYILRGMLISFAIALLVLTVILSLSVIFKLTDLFARGVPVKLVLLLFAAAAPASMIFTVPVSALVSSLLVFGRLSSDGEISAMRTSGISLPRIATPPLLLSLALTVLCLFVNNEVVPRSHYLQRWVIRQLQSISPTDLLVEGRFVQFLAEFDFYVGRKDGNRIEKVIIRDKRTPAMPREITAQHGSLELVGSTLLINLSNVRMDPFLDDRPGAGYIEELQLRIPNAFKTATVSKTDWDLTLTELREAMRDPLSRDKTLSGHELDVRIMAYRVEFNRRLVFSLACLVFVAVGVPLGIKAHRKESSIGIAISIAIMIGFYLSVIASGSLIKHPETRPDLIIWAPIGVAAVISLLLFRRWN